MLTYNSKLFKFFIPLKGNKSVDFCDGSLRLNDFVLKEENGERFFINEHHAVRRKGPMSQQSYSSVCSDNKSVSYNFELKI